MPAWIERRHVGLALAEHAGGDRPAAHLDVAGIVEAFLVEGQEPAQVAGLHLRQQCAVEFGVGFGVTRRAGEMGEPAAGDHRGAHAERREPALHGLAEGVTALDARLRRHVGVDPQRNDRAGDAQEVERDAEGVVDFGVAGERRIEPFRLQVADELGRERARHLVFEVAAGEGPARLGAPVQGERRHAMEQELVGVIVGDDDVDIGLEGCQPPAIFLGQFPDALDVGLVLGLRQGEELRRVRHANAADNARIHPIAP